MCAFSVWPKIHITHPMIDQCLDAFHMAIGARLCSCEKNTSHSHSRTTTALTDQNTRISRATPRIAVTLCNTVSMRQAWCYCAKCVCVCVCVCVRATRSCIGALHQTWPVLAQSTHHVKWSVATTTDVVGRDAILQHFLCAPSTKTDVRNKSETHMA